MEFAGSSRAGRSLFVERLLHLDWLLLTASLIVTATGIFMMCSVDAGYGLMLRQISAAAIGLTGLLLLWLLPYQIFRMYTKPLYVGMIALLIGVLLLGQNMRGTRGWYHFGFFYFQASEGAKVLFVLTIAGYLDRRIQWYTPQSLFVPLLLAMFPVCLILIEPDFSSSLVFFPAILGMLFVAGARSLHLLAICLVGGLATFIPLVSTYLDLIDPAAHGHNILAFLGKALRGGWPGFWLFLGVCWVLILGWGFLRKMRVYIPSLYLWMTLFLIALGTLGAMAGDRALKVYQRKRLVAFVDPNLDPLGGGYNVRQSQIAIGSGRLLGKGYSHGTQSRLGFLPSRHTDFIFSVIGEELGFGRSLLVILFYFLIVWRGYEIALVARDRFGSLVATGYASMFAFYSILNLGMTMGLAPVAGVPLPMVSYGGSSVVSSLLMIGILLSIHWRRHLLDKD